MNKDPYATLGIGRDASADDIKSAYREKAKIYHPDRNNGSDEKFKEVNEAYEMLNDPHKKHMFDRGGNDDFGGFGFGGFGGINPFSQWQNNQQAPRKGSHIEVAVELEFADMFHNHSKTITYDRYETCKFCHGNGLKQGKGRTKCKDCGGSGHTAKVTRVQGGIFQEMRPCNTCKATGTYVSLEDQCDICKGSGFQLVNTSIPLQIQAGVDNGVSMALHNYGHAGINGGPPGDLFVKFIVKPHPLYKRDGNNIIREFEISYVDACLGKSENTELPNGVNVLFNIPPLSQHNSVVTIKGFGVPDLRTSSKGDLHIVVKTKMPKKLTDEYVNLLKQLSELEKQND